MYVKISRITLGNSRKSFERIPLLPLDDLSFTVYGINYALNFMTSDKVEKETIFHKEIFERFA